ncbi:hypothetical protein FOG48_03146 [Hanseniaspora uvarum]|nr:hypothetical protein FOG48_03146 [Hanseniaspora uvarum]
MSQTLNSPLSDTQVNDELVKMQTFIKKEAEEKAKEIKLKANQEYEIEKQSLVKQDIVLIQENNSNKLKKLNLQNEIVKSTINNKMRLKILENKNQILNTLFESALEHLQSFTTDETQYKIILKNLILEGLYKILETSFIIKLREQDVKLVESLLKDIENEYLEKTGLPSVELIISDNEFLVPEHCAGGCIISNKENKISVDNTFDERVKILKHESLPAIRKTLDL